VGALDTDGAQDCRRVVLDANLLNYAPVEELDAIRARGFFLSVSYEGLREVWCRSIDEKSYKFLAGRITRIAHRLSDENPIAFAGSGSIEGVRRAEAGDRREHACRGQR
jgi:hypothetical protein